MTSLRLYIIVTVLAAITLTNFVAVTQGYSSSLKRTEDIFDEQLVEIANMLATLSPMENTKEVFDSQEFAFQVWSDKNQLIYQSKNAPWSPLSILRSGFTHNNFDEYRWRVYTYFDSASLRWVMVAERDDTRFIAAENIALESVFPFIIGLPIVGIIIWLIVGSGFSVLDKLTWELAEKRPDDLHALVTHSSHRELFPVIDAVNRLFKRLDASFQRERRFSADAAHELRTPISALKIHIHNLKEELPDHKQAIEIIDEDLNRLNYLVEQILLLYRTTPEHYKAKMMDTDLYSLAQETIADVYWDIENKQQTVELIGERQIVSVDANSIKIMLKNLLVNANRYSPEGSKISVLLEKGSRGVFMSVIDTGPGIASEEIQRVFDRFYRAGGDRHNSNVSGCGLGLSIVKHIADLHQAEIEMSKPKDHSGLKVCIFFRYKMADVSLMDDQY